MNRKNTTARKGAFIRTTAMVSAALATTCLPAFAQPAEEGEEEIVVTGSRLAQDPSLSSASPVAMVGGEDIRTSGQIDVAVLLRESPSLQASLPGAFSAFNGTPLGASTLNLRNLGDVRTLVLENGRRHVAGIEGTGSVDVNTISTALLGRVDVLTGGASAVYGGDAVTGVVNFVMRDGASFDGLEVRAQTGITDNGDADEYFVSVANGFETTDGRGSMVFGLEYQRAEPILSGDRDFAGLGLATFAPSIDPAFSNQWVRDYRLPISSEGGIIAVGNSLSPPSAFGRVAGSGGVVGCGTFGAISQVPRCQIVDRNGTLRPYNPGDIFIDPFNASGGDGVPGTPNDEIILPRSERTLFQAALDYEVLPSLNFFADVKLTRTETTESNQVNGFNDDIPIALDNPFIPAGVRAQVQSLIANEGIVPAIRVSRDVLDLSARSNPIAERQTYRVVAGFNGELPGLGLDYDIAYNYGRTDADITTRVRLEDRYFAAIDAVEDPLNPGEIICRVDALGDLNYIPPSSPFPVTNSNFGIKTFGLGDCVPVNIFGYDTISPEAAAFIFQPATSQNEIQQENLIAGIRGDTEGFFSLPGGPIDFGVGYEWRRESSSFTPDAFSASGLTFGTLDDRAGPTNPSSGEYSVTEYYAEVQAPLIEGAPLVERLEVNGAYRKSDYNTFGETDTWTVGARWMPIESLTFRTTLSEAVRIPNIGEAFSPTFAATLGADQDPCNPAFINAGSEFRFDNCVALIGATVTNGTYNSTNFLSAFVTGTNGGNPNLRPEEAETLTYGVVWRPTTEFGGLFNGFLVELDYYEIKIDGLIDSLSGFDIAQNCVDAPTIANQFCAAVDRDPVNGFITDFRSGFINLAAVETSGVDWRADYRFALPMIPGEFEVASRGTRFLSNDEVRDVSAPDEVTDVLTTFTIPEWIFNLSADWSIGDWVLGWQGRYESEQLTPGVELDDLANDPNFVDITSTGSSWVHDFSASYGLSERIELYGGINNALEEEPYIGSLGRPAGPRGRFFFVGVNARL